MANPQMYTLAKEDGTPLAYRYGESWVAMKLWIDGGYPSKEEAVAAWEAEHEKAD